MIRIIRNALAVLASTVTASGIAAPSATPSTLSCQAIRIFVPYAPGGGTDVSARLFGGYLGEELKIPVVVENRPGAKSVIAYQALLREPADGCTYLFDNSSNGIQAVYRGLPYDPVRDFKPVAMVEQATNVLVVNPAFPAKTMQEFIDHARRNPGKVSYASFGVGTSSHLSSEILAASAGIEVVHVPYRGSAPAVSDLIGGAVHALIVDPFTAKPLIESGKVRGLAVVGANRSALFPTLPSMGELGYRDLAIPGWWGLFAAANVPDVVVDDVAARLRRIASLPAVREKVEGLGATAYADKPGEFAAIVARDRARWQKVVADRNIALD